MPQESGPVLTEHHNILTEDEPTEILFLLSLYYLAAA